MTYQEPGPSGSTVHVHTAPPSSSGLAVASLVLGILSILFVWIPIVGLISWILAPIGLVLGLVGLSRPAGRGMAVAGTICSAVGLLGCIGWIVLIGAAAAAGAGA